MTSPVNNGSGIPRDPIGQAPSKRARTAPSALLEAIEQSGASSSSQSSSSSLAGRQIDPLPSPTDSSSSSSSSSSSASSSSSSSSFAGYPSALTASHNSFLPRISGKAEIQGCEDFRNMPSFGISLTPCGSNSSQHYSYQEVPTAYDRKVLEKALSECRTLPKGNTNADLGKILGKKGLIQQADQIIQSYNTGISPRDQWELTYRMAQILTANGDSQEAIEVLEEIIEIDPLELVNPHKIEMSEQMQNEAREMNNLKYHLSSLYTMLLVETEDHPSLRSFLFVKPGEFQQGSDIHFRLLIEAANISMRTGKWRLAAVFFERGLTLREYHPPALTADAESQIGLALTICRDNLKYEREEPSESDSSDHKNPS